MDFNRRPGGRQAAAQPELSTPMVLATNNPGKVRELAGLFQHIGVTLVPQSNFQVPAVAEDATTFVENALIKARQAARFTNMAVIADDSGLQVDALDHAPGVRSSRFAGDQATDRDNIEKLLREMDGVPVLRRSGRFYCALVYLSSANDPTPIICTGTWHGYILQNPQGTGGFGYDPVFWVPSHSCSAAQLDADEKRRISHRGQAVYRLLSALVQQRAAC
jgi:XTP/dITP diphosphohydrolase